MYEAIIKKWILITLTVIILLPVTLIIIGIIVLNTTNLNEYRDTITEQVSQAVGRQLNLNGDLELNISTVSSIVVTDITLANATWASEPEMLTIQRLEAEIMLLPLLTGRIHFTRFHLEGVKALAETNASGISNWPLTESADDESVTGEAGTTGALDLFWFDNLYIGDVEFSYHDKQSGQNITANLDHARLISTDKNAPAVIDIAGQVSGKEAPRLGKIILNAKLKGHQSNLQLSELELDIGKVRINGWLNLDTSASIPDIQAELNVTDLNLDKLAPEKKKVEKKTKPGKKPEDEKLFSGEPLPFDALSQANIKATILANNLVHNNQRLKEVEISIHLVDGKLSASLHKHSLLRDKFVADIVIDAGNVDAPTSTATIKVPRLELGELLISGGGNSRCSLSMIW